MKKILAVVVALGLCGFIYGCQKKAEEPVAKDAVKAAQPMTPPPAPAAAPAPAPAPEGETK